MPESRRAYLARQLSRFLTFVSSDARVFFLIIAFSLPLVIALFMRDLENLSNYHGDENYWIYVGNKSFRLFFIERDFSNPFWQDSYFAYGSYNPQIGKYIIGSGIYFAGFGNILSKGYDFGHDTEWNRTQGNVRESSIVGAARTPVAFLGLASCALLYWIAALVTNRWNAFVAASYLAGSQLLLQSSRRAMIDTPALFFGLLALACMVYLLRAVHKGKTFPTILLSIFAGISCGMAIGTKMNALLVMGVCELALLVESIRCVARSRKALVLPALSLAILSLTALLVFFGSNPFLYNTPVQGTLHLSSYSQLLSSPWPYQNTPTLDMKLGAVASNILGYAPLNQAGLPGDAWLFLFGIVGLGMIGLKSPGDFWDSSLGIIALWIIASFVGISLWLPMNWDRYFLPLMPCAAFVEAYGTVWLLKKARLSLIRSNQSIGK